MKKVVKVIPLPLHIKGVCLWHKEKRSLDIRDFFVQTNSVHYAWRAMCAIGLHSAFLRCCCMTLGAAPGVGNVAVDGFKKGGD